MVSYHVRESPVFLIKMDEETLIDVDVFTESASSVGLSTINGKQGIVNGLGYHRPLVRRDLLSIFFCLHSVCRVLHNMSGCKSLGRNIPARLWKKIVMV